MPAPFKVNRFLLDIGIDTGLALVALWLTTLIRPLLPFGRPLREAEVDLPVYLLVVLVWAAVFPQFNLYAQRPHRLRYTLGALVLAVGVALLIMAGALYLSFRELSRLQFITFGAIALVLLTAAHLARAVRRRRDERWRVLIVGASNLGRTLAERLGAQPGSVSVIGFLDDGHPPGSTICAGLSTLGNVDETTRIVREQSIDEVILAMPREHYPRLLSLIADLESLPVQLSLAPDVLDLAWFVTRVEDLNGVPVLRLRQSPLDGPMRAVKRLMDLLIGSVMLLCSLPLMAVVALAIKLDSPGPAVIKQTRIGEGMRPFQMYKFRTMYVGTERQPPPDLGAHKRPNDPRVTWLGRWLRRYSLDELPQLFNVLKGEMSLVGPRPELPWLVERYQTWQRRRFAVPPGMTGWWQVNGRSERPMHLHVEDDLHYIRNYSLWLDVIILLRTIPVVLSGRGAF